MDSKKQKQLVEYYSMYLKNLIHIDILTYQCKIIEEHIEILTAVRFIRGPALQRSNARSTSLNPFHTYELQKEFVQFNEFLLSIIYNDSLKVEMKNEILKKAKEIYFEKEIEFTKKRFDDSVEKPCYFTEKLLNMMIKRSERDTDEDIYGIIVKFCEIIKYNVLNDDKSLCFEKFYLKREFEESGTFRLELLQTAVEYTCPIDELWKVILLCIYINNDIDPDIKYSTNVPRWYSNYLFRTSGHLIGDHFDDDQDDHDNDDDDDENAVDASDAYTVDDDELPRFSRDRHNLVKDICETIRIVAYQRRKSLLAVYYESYL